MYCYPWPIRPDIPGANRKPQLATRIPVSAALGRRTDHDLRNHVIPSGAKGMGPRNCNAGVETGKPVFPNEMQVLHPISSPAI